MLPELEPELFLISAPDPDPYFFIIGAGTGAQASGAVPVPVPGKKVPRICYAPISPGEIGKLSQKVVIAQ